MSRLSRRFITLLGLVALPLAGCSDGVGLRGGDARLTVLLTDAAASYLKEANVSIGAVHIKPANGPAVELTDEGGEFNLLALQNGVTAVLAEQVMEPARYLWLRLEVLGTDVVLEDDFHFASGGASKEFHIPSGSSRGIQINLRYSDDDHQAAGIQITPGETVLVVDFDVNQSFRVLGKPSASGAIKGMLFTPLLRATVTDVAGSIAGTVTEPADFEWPTDPSVALTDLIVRATLQDSEELAALQTPSGTSTIDEDGSYRIWFLAPGTYTVTVEHPGFEDGPAIEVSTDPESRTVTLARSEDRTGVDFELSAVEVQEEEEEN